ncbi:unnamed protein product [Orchesella dallaii]|uniref:CRAL-TRIO domain-containing protein n=1 Tax=Orchesella dallaii TaxID=48710 RepID=A0ABP1Q360_9HEXA
MNRVDFEFFSSCIIVLVIFVNINVNAIGVKKFLSLSFEEKSALDKFRARVAPLLDDNCMRHDTYLVRWLRARNFDIHAAEVMLRENLKWRKDQKVENTRNEDFSDLKQDFHLTLDTYDKIGQPIGVIDLYEWDMRRAVLQGKSPRLVRYIMALVENITGQVCERQQKGMNVTQVMVLLNADGINVVQQACPICMPLWIQFITSVENYYPEWIDEFIIVDSSPAVQIILNVIRPFFSRNTRNAIKVFGHNRKNWMTYLDNKISRSERRKEYGGIKPPFRF